MDHYSNDFKRDALRYIQEHPEMKIKDIADYLGVTSGTLYDWNTKMHRSYILGENVPTNSPMTDEEKELARLKRENRDINDALEILKKLSGF